MRADVEKHKPVVWSIAGSDNSGGAGIQADNLTFNDFGVHGCNIVTAITAQNNTGVHTVDCVSEVLLCQQWDTLIPDYHPAVIKLGMLGNETIVSPLVKKLATLDAIVVCDPVLSASSGGRLIDHVDDYLKLLEYVDILTPNQQEFAEIFKLQFSTPTELEQCALEISQHYGVDLMVTGGESLLQDFSQSSDLCIISGELFWLHSPRSNSKNTHGTGCTLASAIAAALACGYDRYEAMVLAKAYINVGFLLDVCFSGGKGAVQHAGFPSRLDCLPTASRHYECQPVSFPRCDTLRLGTYPVVNSIEWLERCLEAGVKTLQLRVKNVAEEELDAMIASAAELGRCYQARLFINDYWQLAIKHQAYGVHLGQEDLDDADMQAIAEAGLHLGISTHSWFEIARAHSLKPSYIAIGPIYATTTKVMKFAPQGLQQLQQWLQLIGDAYPVVAIGGIDLGNTEAVLQTGVGSVAMVRAVTEAEDYKAAIAAFDHQVERYAKAV